MKFATLSLIGLLHAATTLVSQQGCTAFTTVQIFASHLGQGNARGTGSADRTDSTGSAERTDSTGRTLCRLLPGQGAQLEAAFNAAVLKRQKLRCDNDDDDDDESDNVDEYADDPMIGSEAVDGSRSSLDGRLAVTDTDSPSAVAASGFFRSAARDDVRIVDNARSAHGTDGTSAPLAAARAIASRLFHMPSTHHRHDVGYAGGDARNGQDRDIVLYPVVGFRMVHDDQDRIVRVLPTTANVTCRLPSVNERLYGWFSPACHLDYFQEDPCRCPDTVTPQEQQQQP